MNYYGDGSEYIKHANEVLEFSDVRVGDLVLPIARPYPYSIIRSIDNGLCQLSTINGYNPSSERVENLIKVVKQTFRMVYFYIEQLRYPNSLYKSYWTGSGWGSSINTACVFPDSSWDIVQPVFMMPGIITAVPVSRKDEAPGSRFSLAKKNQSKNQ